MSIHKFIVLSNFGFQCLIPFLFRIANESKRAKELYIFHAFFFQLKNHLKIALL